MTEKGGGKTSGNRRSQRMRSGKNIK